MCTSDELFTCFTFKITVADDDDPYLGCSQKDWERLVHSFKFNFKYCFHENAEHPSPFGYCAFLGKAFIVTLALTR